MTEKDIEPRRMFVCAGCGTMAHTDSGKKIVGSVHVDIDDPLDGKADHERAVRMDPRCPCGCRIFNPIEVPQVHYDDVSDESHVVVGAEAANP